MIKKLDAYSVKTFLGPFVFIFSILFFIFTLQIAWQKLGDIAGKGLSWYKIVELLFHAGMNFVPLILPLTILLGSIMTFGGFGERYELAAMKSTGISLMRIMRPLMVLVIGFSLFLFYISDSVIPFTQEKSKTMLFNIVRTNPTLQFQSGVFIEGIPEYSLKVNAITGENNENLQDVYIRNNATVDRNQRTIIAENGKIIPDSTRKHYIKMELYNGFIFEEVKERVKNRTAQPESTIHFDTLYQYFDVSSLLEVKNDSLGKHYKFLKTRELATRIDSVDKNTEEYYDNLSQGIVHRTILRKAGTEKLLKKDSIPKKYTLPFVFEKLRSNNQKRLVQSALEEVRQQKEQYNRQKDDIRWRAKSLGTQKLHYQRNFAYPFTCIIFFLIGAPLGAIVKKGGIGLPVVISIIVFVIFYIINLTCENMAKDGALNGHVAAWVANVFFFPIGIFLTYKATVDSDLFAASKYTEKINAFFKKLISSSTYVQAVVVFLEKLFPSDEEETEEHERYK